MLRRSRSASEEPSRAAADDRQEQRHRCPEPGCSKQFARRYSLGEHLKTHTGEKPHVCPVAACAKRFATSGNLARHKRLHGVIQPLECPFDGCACAFPSQGKLDKHLMAHFGNAQHVCPAAKCGKTFSTTGNLNRHLRNFHPELHQPELALLNTARPSPSAVDEGEPMQDSRPSWSDAAITASGDDARLEALASALEGAGLDAPGEAECLIDDIVRFHVEHLDGARARALTR